MKNTNLKYFLAANSCQGFVSYFAESYNAKADWRTYIIKGGPGTGKSSFMKYVAARAQEKNQKILLCPCSSDPDSLDAIILEDKKIIILDGTSPHTVDPSYPGAVEEIVNLGAFWKPEALREKREAIIELTDKNKVLHKAVSGYLRAAGQFLKENSELSSSAVNKEKALLFAKSVVRKHIPKRQRSKSPVHWTRFLGGVTPKGIIGYGNTVLAECDKLIIINDDLGAPSNIVIKYIEDIAFERGYDTITLKNPLLPEDLRDGIIIPELSFAVVRESDYLHFDTELRRIHARRFTLPLTLSKNRSRIKFNKKTAEKLLLSSISLLKEAKKVHDDLEKNYIDAMDFEALTEYATNFAKGIL